MADVRALHSGAPPPHWRQFARIAAADAGSSRIAREEDEMRFWSEVPAARARELAADIATWAWVGLWTVIAWRLYSTLAGFAEIGRTVGQGGTNIQAAGRQIGEFLGRLPLVGQGVRGLTEQAFGTAGEPFVFVGGELEELFLMIAALLGVRVGRHVGRIGRWVETVGRSVHQGLNEQRRGGAVARL